MTHDRNGRSVAGIETIPPRDALFDKRILKNFLLSWFIFFYSFILDLKWLSSWISLSALVAGEFQTIIARFKPMVTLYTT
jgi:hypothetical protein